MMTRSDKIKASHTGKSHAALNKPSARPISWKMQACMLFVLVAVGCIIYSNSLHSPFVFDDHEFILNDYACRMTRPGWDAITKAALEGQPHHRLIPNISFAFNYYFGRYDTFGYHLVNIVIHLLAGIFLFFFIKNTLAIYCENVQKKPVTPDLHTIKAHPEIIAFLTALLWLVQPVATQSTTYIYQRMASMVTMFYILSLLFYLKGRVAMKKDLTHRLFPFLNFFFCFIAGLCAVMTKENAGMLPFFILLYECFFFRDLKFFHSKRRIIWIAGVLFIFAIITALYLGENPIHRILSSYTRRDFTLPQRVLTEFRVVIYYLSLFLWAPPWRLNLYHHYPLSMSLTVPSVTLLCIIAIVALLCFAMYSAKKDRIISFCILWFLGNLVIESSVIGLEIIFEHRTYLPFMLISLLIVILIFRYVNQQIFSIIILLFLCLFFSFWTFQRNITWQDTLTFTQNCAQKSPNYFRSQNDLGVILLQRGNMDTAIQHFRKAIKANPSFTIAHINIGNALRAKGNIDGAIEEYKKALQTKQFKKIAYTELGKTMLFQLKNAGKAIFYLNYALKLDPNDFQAHYAMAGAMSKAGMVDKAISHYKTALKINPNNSDAQNDVANTFARKGMAKEALLHYQLALKINPGNKNAHRNLGSLLTGMGKLDEAVEQYRAALAIDPNDPQIHYRVGMLYQMKGMFGSAISHYQTALSLQPGFTGALFGIGVGYASLENYNNAQSAFKKIIALRPDNPLPYYNIACIFSRQNKKKQAVDWLTKAVEHGYDNWKHLKADPDLQNIRDTAYYRNLLKKHNILNP